MASLNVGAPLRSGTDDFALTLKKEGSAMVLEALRTGTVLCYEGSAAISKKVDSSGYQHRFIRKGWDVRPEIAYEFGAELVGQSYGFSEVDIALDQRPIVKHAALSKHLMAVSDFNMAAPVLKGLVDETMREIDRRAFLALHKASRVTSGATLLDSNGVLTISNGANRVNVQNATSLATQYSLDSTGAQNFRKSCAALRLLARQRDLDDSMQSDLYITPYIAQVLSYDTGIYDVRFSQNASDNNYNRAKVGMIEGFNIVVVPGTDRIRTGSTGNINSSTGANGYPSRYWGNYSYGAKASAGEVAALAVWRGPEGAAPVGMRQLGPIETDIVPQGEKRSSLFVVDAWVGFDVLDPYLCGSIEVTSDA